jgi:hypothetical protein
LQQQRQALLGGGGNKRRQAELQTAMARSGCGGVRAPQPRRGGGLFDIFGGGREEEEEQYPQMPIYRSIDPNGRYRSVCVRLCDGFFYPIHYSTYGSQLGQDAQLCQSSCAAPAELYVYRNPGQDIERAVSLSGSAYMDLPVALRFRKEYVKGCSCKQAEYNPTEIEASNKRAEGGTDAQPAQGQAGATAEAPPLPAPPAPQAAAPQAGASGPEINLDITGSNEPLPPPQADATPAAIPEAQQPPPPPPPPPAVEAAAPPPPPPAVEAAAPPPPAPPPPAAEPAPPPAPPAAAQAAPPPPAAAAAADPATQSTVAKRKAPPRPPPASGFGPQF